MQSLRSRLLRERADALAYTPTCTSENKPFFINLRCFIRLIFRRIETLATSTMSRVDCEPPVRVQQSINKLHNTRLCIVLLWCICFSLLLPWCSVEWRFDTATADSFTTWHMDRVEDIGHYRFLICTVSSAFFFYFSSALSFVRMLLLLLQLIERCERLPDRYSGDALNCICLGHIVLAFMWLYYMCQPNQHREPCWGATAAGVDSVTRSTVSVTVECRMMDRFLRAPFIHRIKM